LSYDEDAILDTIAKVSKSTVNISALKIVHNIFYQAVPVGGIGSGTIIDSKGLILTNNHVVGGAHKINVTLGNDEVLEGSIVGSCSIHDLAVVKINSTKKNLQPAELGNSDKIRVGQRVYAIGNPFGLTGGPSVTSGVISAINRTIESESVLIENLVQTDASINPGNSGGVLLNDAGQVIGVTAAIATDSGSSSGVGFAIPSTIVQQVVPNLIKNGHYDHPWLGVSVTSLTPDIVDSMKLQSGQRGALVEQVIANSPADKAGLQASQRQVTINGQPFEVGGDVIIAFGSQTVRGSDDLVTYLSEYGSIGQTVSLTVIRDGKQIQVSVTLAARPFSS